MLALVANQFEGEAKEEKENVETKYWFRIGEFRFIFCIVQIVWLMIEDDSRLKL